MGGAFVLAAVAVLVLVPRPSAELEVAIRRGAEARALDLIVAGGDRLVITARPRGVADPRVFGANRKLVARCPGGPACTASAREGYTLDVALSAPATYDVISAVGLSDAPTDDTMDGYLDAARAANARIIAYPPIDVR